MAVSSLPFDEALLPRESTLILERELWRNRQVFLTGHTGFKGGWLSLWLEHLGAKVAGYSLAPPTQPAIFDELRLADSMQHTIGDIRDASKLRESLQQYRPEVVFHLAAQSLVRASYVDPVATYETNVMGTVNLLEACRSCESVKAVVIITTDKCYENREWSWGYRENEPMGGHDPYSNSKGCAELVTAAYRASFFNTRNGPGSGVKVATARAGNVVGGGDWAMDRLVPDMVRSFSQGEAAVIRSPKAIRPWQHVLEALGGYLHLAQKLLGEDGHKVAEGWNFGPLGTASVGDVVELLVDKWGKGASWRLDSGAHPHEAHLLKLDISKAAAELNWSPILQLEETVEWLADWYRSYYEGGSNMRELTLEQIIRYESLAAARLAS